MKTLNIIFYSLLILLFIGCNSQNAEMIDDPVITINSTVEYYGEQRVNSPITITVTGMPAEMSYGFKIMPEYNINVNHEISGNTVVYQYKKPGTYFIKGAGQDINNIWHLTYSGKQITIRE